MENKNFDLQELIEKATPKKATILEISIFDNSFDIKCPNCNKVLTIYNDIGKELDYCYICGQRISQEVNYEY